MDEVHQVIVVVLSVLRRKVSDIISVSKNRNKTGCTSSAGVITVKVKIDGFRVGILTQKSLQRGGNPEVLFVLSGQVHTRK